MTTLLVIAGTDSSGGAGLTRDTAIAAQLGVTVKPVVTAVTAQTDQALRHIHPVPAPVVAAQMAAALDPGPPDAIKIGMLGSSATADTVAEALRTYDGPVILDPVLKSSSGGDLSDKVSLGELIAMATLVTPNLDEAAALTDGAFAGSDAGIATQAGLLRRAGARAVLVKGGHGGGKTCVDHLFDTDGHHRFSAPRQAKSRRGTGCFLATAIACHLASGHPLRDACARSHQLIQRWIAGG